MTEIRVKGGNRPIAPARADDPPPVVSHGNDAAHLAGALGSCGSQSHEFGAGSAGEVVEVHAGEHPVVGGHDRGAHRVDAVFVGPGVGMRVYRAACQLHELTLVIIESSCR
ncbi:hypothetical protein J7E99_07480 [Streptomyces sp. ISL-44]|uniref:hypothetical protein n=1 Tax=Streptomyces sp. ISL-44 TaxID=2819184 RepID=UPI001BE9B700|nr:hypothetical protein [Streptomyces sp. ISL-44]MBT2540545.1 hypothetical protein [Streptomyces sp. ISL-44]